MSAEPLDGTRMELLGIALFIPLAALAFTAYAAIARGLFERFGSLARIAGGMSAAVLLVFVTELIAVGTFGVLRSREILGLPFLVAHSLSLLLAPPALANVLVLAMKSRRSWYVASAAAACLAIGLLFLNIHISEVLYGIDGSGGPYGKPGWLCFPARAV